MKSIAVLLTVWIGLLTLPGCTALNKVLGRGPKPKLPAILVLPFTCDNKEIGAAITKGFKDEITTRLEILDPGSFRLYIATQNARVSQKLPGFTPLPGIPQISSSAAPSSDELAPPAPKGPSPDELLQGLPNDSQARRRLRKESGVAYLVAGQAKEQVQTELEAGNIKTAATASVRVWDLETNELLSEEAFKQGFFEIVVPERIGSKLAERVNRRFKEIRREDQIRTELNAR
jgi:hypothetical protein